MAARIIYTNYSNGWVIEVVTNPEGPCTSYFLLPGENLWSVGARGFIYCLALLYIFIGVAIASDIFMCSIEMITSKRRTIVRWDEEKQERVEREVLVWNETVANLTLMALGSSAPEILLAIGETFVDLGKDTSQLDGLGTFTIIGSAAFNLLIITAICIVSVPSPDTKRIQEVGVFVLTSIWSIFAYLWMLITLVAISPNVVEPWEAWLTLAFFPIMVLTAYCQDSHWWCKRNKSVGVMDESQTNVRVVMAGRTGTIHGMAKELGALEKEKNLRSSRLSLKSLNEKEPGGSTEDQNETLRKDHNLLKAKEMDAVSQGSQAKLVRAIPNTEISKQTYARARFRHAAVRSMLGGRKHHVPKEQTLIRKQTMADVVESMRKTLGGKEGGPSMPSDEELLGKFTFASPSYSVLESSGIMEIDILFHRLPPSKATNLRLANGCAGNGENETSFSNEPINTDGFVHKGVVTVEYETREGSAKIDKDFKYSAGSLVFKETEYRKSITVPIINDQQYEADVDFYVILKNPSGDAGISDPNITRVMIIDDDEPGEFQFEEPHYYADISLGQITVNVVRQRGCDGTVSIEYSTIDGTAKGGDEIQPGVDYIRTENVINFKHGETTKPIVIEVNKATAGSKNFIITLRNPSIGAKVGEHSATVCNITTDNIAERLADVMDENEEETTWGGQFRNALTLECDKDEDGNDIPLKWYDYTLHFISFLWKVLLAFIPPTRYLGAWPTFVISIAVIGLLTIVIQQLASLLSCVVGLKSAVAGITIIALGTSLPDTFASRTAALHDEGADAAIGNVTGSNSVNVFLGLGFPWVIQSIYSLVVKKEFRVKTTNLTQSVIIFSIAGTICIFMLLIRRYLVGGELGGKNPYVKWGCSIFLVVLWAVYITLSSIKAYDDTAFPW